MGEHETPTHIGASALIFNERNELCCLWHRKMGKLHLPGGKCEPGESSKLGLARELQEELDINPTSSFLVAEKEFPKREYPDGSGIFVDISQKIYVVRSYDGMIHNVEDQKHAGILWMNIMELLHCKIPKSFVLEYILNDKTLVTDLLLPWLHR